MEIVMESVVKLERVEESLIDCTMTPCHVKEEWAGDDQEAEALEECEMPLLVLLPHFQEEEEEIEEENNGAVGEEMRGEEEEREYIVPDEVPADSCWQGKQVDNARTKQQALTLGSCNIQKHLLEEGYTDSLCGFCKTMYSLATCPALCDHNYAGHICVCPEEGTTHSGLHSNQFLSCDICNKLCPGVDDLYRHLLDHVKPKDPHPEDRNSINNVTVIKSSCRVRKQLVVQEKVFERQRKPTDMVQRLGSVQVKCDKCSQFFGTYNSFRNHNCGIEKRTLRLLNSHESVCSSKNPVVDKMKSPEVLRDGFSHPPWRWTGPVRQYSNRRKT